MRNPPFNKEKSVDGEIDLKARMLAQIIGKHGNELNRSGFIINRITQKGDKNPVLVLVPIVVDQRAKCSFDTDIGNSILFTYNSVEIFHYSF